MISTTIIAVAIFAIVYFLIIFGRKRFDIPIWTSMLIGAALMIGFQIIDIQSVFKSINLDVIGFLFGMFSIVSALDKSGVLTVVSAKMLSKAKNNPNLILLVFVVGMGLLSAFLVNDTIAVLGIPFVVYISNKIGIDYSVLVFFAAMFVFTYGLWLSGIVPEILSHFPTPDKHDIFQSNAIISAISIGLSQLLSNVPFVAIYNTVMINNGFASGVNSGGSGVSNTSQWMMLAAASTIAGNLTILAAASNIIIIESADSRDTVGKNGRKKNNSVVKITDVSIESNGGQRSNGSNNTNTQS